MAAISKIHINGFKAFPEEFTLDLDGKNLLMYGENGSGKSSIYYALHCMFQSQCKDKGSVYFNPDPNCTESIVNKDTKKQDAYVELEFHGDATRYKYSKDGYVETPQHPVSVVRDLNGECVFINHKFLFHAFSFRNSQYIDLFPVFIKDILPFRLTSDRTQFISQIYDEIKLKIQRKARGRRIGKEYDEKIKLFNKETLFVIAKINQFATGIYNNHFKDNDERELNIELKYDNNSDKIPQPNKSYWLRHGYRHQIEVVANETQVLQLSKREEILDPVITLEIKEKQADGSFRKIDKPHVHFNEARITAIILSIRFALLDNIEASNGRFMALDDMLISLDMSNRMKVIDYLLGVAVEKYKLYIFTHDRLLYSSFKSRIKLDKKHNDWLFEELYMHKFDENNNYKPCIPTPRPIPDKDGLLRAFEYYVIHDYPASGQILRKECESILDQLLPDTLKKCIDTNTGKTKDCNLNDKIRHLEQYCKDEGLVYSNYKNLKIYKDDLLNTVSHYDVSSPIYGNEILNIMHILKELRDIVNTKRKIKVNHNLGIKLTTGNGDALTICIDIKNKQLGLIGTVPRITYYTRCEVDKLIIKGAENPIEKVYASIYEAYDAYCTQYGIIPAPNLIDVLFSNGIPVKNLI